ncbi:MAG: peptidase P60 [Betaproteobacteria bacterium]|nr:peptidase P60 [Betaproteobacteria bacterium]
MTRAAEIVAIARETIGTPYGHQGRVNGLALDCAGVPVHVARRLGMSFDDITNYGRLPVPVEMRRALDANLVRVAKADMQIGDVAWIRFQAEPQHFAVVGDYPHGGFSLIHAYNGAGLRKVVEHRLDAAWLARIVAVWRFPGVEL